jgi:glycosyltransferase involved in cell wall biosynthesis
MKILVLAWEFPPRIVGGISRHVAELYPEIVNLGHEVHLITIALPQAPDREVVQGIWVYRVPVPETDNFPAWVEGMNHSMITCALALETTFDLIHGHDWLVAKASIELAQKLNIPLISTIHATEYGRNNGIHTDGQRHIHLQEISLTQASQRVIVCSHYMQGEIDRALGCPPAKSRVIFNGLNPSRVAPSGDLAHNLPDLRRKYAQPDEAIVYYVGRITYEKGIYVLLNAAPKILFAMHDRVKFVLIGTGTAYSILLQRQAWDLGIYHKTIFTGFMGEEDLYRFQAIADCAVFPSLYEPFGIVALESFAAGVPVVVSDTGGLPEVVKHRETGIVTKVNDQESLAQGIIEILQNPDLAQQLTRNARRDLQERFAWTKLAQQTVAVYGEVYKLGAVPC